MIYAEAMGVGQKKGWMHAPLSFMTTNNEGPGINAGLGEAYCGIHNSVLESFQTRISAW